MFWRLFIDWYMCFAHYLWMGRCVSLNVFCSVHVFLPTVFNAYMCFSDCLLLCHLHRREEVSVNEALSILSRGLEANRDSVDLWLHYLSVYRQKQDLSDLYHLHKQAVHFAPCYPLYWKASLCLFIVKILDFTQKNEEFRSCRQVPKH